MSVLIHKSNLTEEKLLLLLVYPFSYIFATIFFILVNRKKRYMKSNENEGRLGGMDGDLKSNFWQLFESKRIFFVISKLFSFPFFSFQCWFKLMAGVADMSYIKCCCCFLLNFFLTRNRFNAIHTWWCHTLWLVASYFSIIYDLYVRITSRIGARHNGHTPPLIPPRQCFIAQS